MAQFEPDLQTLARGDAMMARGLLLALAAPCIAALALDPAAAATSALRILAETAVAPGFFAVAGWLAAPWLASGHWGRLLGALAPVAFCGAAAWLAIALSTPAAVDAVRGLLDLAAPAFWIAILPVFYGPIAFVLRASPGACLCLAVVSHVAGVILAAPALIHFVFFVAGWMLAARRGAVDALARDEPELAVASAPFVAVLAGAVSIRFAQGGQAPSIAALGPIALALGLAIGPSALASAMALRGTSAGESLGRLGRTGPALAIFWIPLFSILMKVANRGAAPTLVSALLMAFSSLLIVALAADAILDAAEGSPIRRFLAPS